MAVFGMVLGLVLLIFFVIRGVPIIISSLISATVILLVSSANIQQGLMENFASGLSGFIKMFFVLFVLGAIFGKLVEISGATDTIARAVVGKFGEKYVMIGIAVTSAIFCFGGISVYVALFALYPLAMSLFKKADIPRRLFTGVYMAGAATFAMTAPFAPSVQNVVPTKYLSTTVAALPIHGIIIAIFQAIFVIWYMHHQMIKCKKNGEHFVPLASDVEVSDTGKRPNLIFSLIPLVTLITVLNVFKFSIEASLLAGIVACIICYFPYFPKDMSQIWKHVSVATSDGITAIMNTSATVGFGTVIAKSAGFASIIPIITELPIHPLISSTIVASLLSAIAGSASGGLGITVPIVAQVFLPMGVNPDALHRLLVVSSGGFSCLPHNGGIVTFLNYSKTSHKEGYNYVFVVTMVSTAISMVVLIALLALTGYM